MMEFRPEFYAHCSEQIMSAGLCYGAFHWNELHGHMVTTWLDPLLMLTQMGRV